MLRLQHRLSNRKVELVLLQPIIANFHFGLITAIAPSITHTFVVANNTSCSETVDHLQPSCGCTSALIAPSGKQNHHGIIQPGGSIAVRVSIDPSHLAPGAVDKVVWVLVKGQKEPIAALHMVGFCTAATTFSPPQIDFGSLKAGTPTSAVFSVSVDKTLLDAQGHIPVTATDPDLTLTNLPDEPARTASATAQTVTFRYRVSLSPQAALGDLSARIRVGENIDNTTDEASSVVVIGHVVGEISAAPSVIALGVVRPGSICSRGVLLSVPPGLVPGLTVETDDPRLKATLDTSAPATANRRPFGATASVPVADQLNALRVIPMTVTLDTAALVGSATQSARALTAKVIVHDAHGERLVLPVYGSIEAPSNAQ